MCLALCYPKQKLTHLLESQNSQRGVPQFCIVLEQFRFQILSSDLLSIHATDIASNKNTDPSLLDLQITYLLIIVKFYFK
jgi:hypothetical protein